MSGEGITPDSTELTDPMQLPADPAQPVVPTP